MLFALLALCSAQELQVDGLRDGESFELLAPGDDSAAERLAGRIVDALSGEPIANAVIETWTEENDAVFGGFHRTGEARSAVDGRFRITAHPRYEKTRVRAAGYATLSAARALPGVLEL